MEVIDGGTVGYEDYNIRDALWMIDVSYFVIGTSPIITLKNNSDKNVRITFRPVAISICV